MQPLEVPFINCKIHLGSSWTKNCVMSDSNNNNNNKEFKIPNTGLYFPINTLFTEGNVKLNK